jgi:hypothetical protein
MPSPVVAFAACALAALASTTASAASPGALDCSPGFDAIHKATTSQPGVTPEMTLDAEWNWSGANSVLDIFTLPNNPAHPAVLHLVLQKDGMRTWAGYLSGCAFGDQEKFKTWMASYRDLNRSAIEDLKEGRPVGPPPAQPD